MKLFPKKIQAAIAVLALGFSVGAQATVVDLTAGLGTSGSINGATYSWITQMPTGSGYIDPFVRVGSGAGSVDVVHGYNTTVDNVYNTDSTDTFNHEVTVGQLGFIDTLGGKVMRFLLDINQNSGRNSSMLSLDEVQIYLSKIPNQSIEPDINVQPTINLGQLVYRMDAGDATSYVKLDYDAQTGGSGKGDMYLDIPIAMFMAAFAAGGADYDTIDEQNGAYLYLYSRFGENNANNDGYEEWTHIQGDRLVCDPQTDPNQCDGGGGEQEIPEPGTLAILGAGLLGLAYARRRGTR